jgi:DNA-damage-inducible protein D
MPHHKIGPIEPGGQVCYENRNPGDKMVDPVKEYHVAFDTIRRVDQNGTEYWTARDLSRALEYHEYRNILAAIARAKEACANSGENVDNHFVDFNEMVFIGSGAQRSVDNIALSRYACYLIVQNGDPSKPVIAIGQTYFALQTRRQEIADEKRFSDLTESQKRLAIRQEMVEHNKALVAAAQNAGVETTQEFAIFQDHGYRGLYGGLGARDIHVRKELKKSQKILDHMGSTELAANLFRATQTEEKLKRENVQGKSQANRTHQKVGERVRQTIKDLGGTMPENLPTPEKSIKQLEREKKKLESKDQE